MAPTLTDGHTVAELDRLAAFRIAADASTDRFLAALHEARRPRIGRPSWSRIALAVGVPVSTLQCQLDAYRTRKGLTA